MDERELAENMQKLLILMSRLDQRIAPMLDADGEYFNQRYILVLKYARDSKFINFEPKSAQILMCLIFHLIGISNLFGV